MTVGARQCYRLWKNKVSCHCPQEWNGCSILQKILKDFQPEGISKGNPLDTLLDTFLVKEKYPQGGCVSPQGNFRFVQAAVWGRK